MPDVSLRTRTQVAATAAGAVVALAAVLVCVPTVAQASPSSPAARREMEAQREIALAFRAFGTLPPVSRGRALLQGYDRAMWLALQQSGTKLLDGANGAPAKVSEATGTAAVVRPGEAAVPLTITMRTTPPPPSYSLHYTGVALETRGRWQVSWTTMCLLVESANELCPPTPAHLVPGDVLPSAQGGPLDSTSLSPGFVNPGPLAIAPDGGVLIADQARNQILEWRNGSLSVVAGDGLEGFSGDGGPAVDAELNSPGEIAVGPTGTVYFADRGNQRVRAVSADGTIETVAGDGDLGNEADLGDGGPATAAPLNPSGIAVSPGGVLYIASNSDIREVAPDGVISTLVAGGPPAGDVEADGTPTAFLPESLALNGQGDLIVFSFSPKLLFSVSPAGQVTELGQDYATALSSAPDGSVLVAQHGEGLGQVIGTTMAALPVDTRVPGLRYSLVAEGIAEAPNGETYVDTEPGDGFTDQTGLYEIVGGVARPVPISTPITSTLPAIGATGFPAAVFPTPRPSRGADPALPACPSLQGVTPFTKAVENEARQLLAAWNTGFSYNLHASDRAWWPGVVGTFTGSTFQGRQTVGPVKPTADSLYGPAIAAACRRALVRDSIQVLMGPSPYDFSYQHVFLLDRAGTPLVYFAAY
jgi:hypothetical protein